MVLGRLAAGWAVGSSAAWPSGAPANLGNRRGKSQRGTPSTSCCQRSIKQVNAQLAAMNQQLNIVLYTNLFVGKGLAMQLAARSSKDCIHIGVGKQGSPAQLTAIPPRHELVGTHRDLGSLDDSW